MRFFTFVTMLFLGSIISAMEDIDVSQPLYIEELMPRKDQVSFLAIEPAIPRNYVALSITGKINYFSELVYWGPEDVVNAYFKDRSSLSIPILQVAFTENLVQTKMGVLDEEIIKTDFEKNVKNPNFKSGKWGEYPYYRVSGQMEGIEFNMAYVGLNHESGAVLLFHLVTPNVPNGKAIALEFWDNFFKNTKQLPEPLYFRVAGGQELHPGYTIVNIAGRKTKVIAEKRLSDRKIQFVVLPEDETITFKYENAFETPMLADWHFFEPVLKIKGIFMLDKGWITYSMITTILIKEVETFTPITSQNKNIFALDFFPTNDDKLPLPTHQNTLENELKRLRETYGFYDPKKR